MFTEYGFTSMMLNNKEKPKCLMCGSFGTLHKKCTQIILLQIPVSVKFESVLLPALIEDLYSVRRGIKHKEVK